MCVEKEDVRLQFTACYTKLEEGYGYMGQLDENMIEPEEEALMVHVN